MTPYWYERKLRLWLSLLIGNIICELANSQQVKKSKSSHHFVFKEQMGPGLYYDIGKKAKDLLYKDYGDHPATYFSYQSFKWNFDLSCETQEILPGLTTLFRFIIPDSCKAELRFLQDYFGIAAGVGVKSYEQGSFKGNGYNPVVNLSGVLGSTFVSLATDVVFDISRSAFDHFSAGLSFKNTSLITSLSLEDKFTSLSASCYHEFNPMTRTAIAAELKQQFGANAATTFAVGAQHELFPFIFLKARADSDAKVGALVKLELWQKLLLGIAGEVNFRDGSSQVSRIGFSLALNS